MPRVSGAVIRDVFHMNLYLFCQFAHIKLSLCWFQNENKSSIELLFCANCISIAAETKIKAKCSFGNVLGKRNVKHINQTLGILWGLRSHICFGEILIYTLALMNKYFRSTLTTKPPLKFHFNRNRKRWSCIVLSGKVMYFYLAGTESPPREYSPCIPFNSSRQSVSLDRNCKRKLINKFVKISIKAIPRPTLELFTMPSESIVNVMRMKSSRNRKDLGDDKVFEMFCKFQLSHAGAQ